MLVFRPDPDPKEKLPVVFRDVQAADWPFIYDSWINTYRDSMLKPRSPGRRAFSRAVRARINLLRDRGAVFKVACWDADPDTIIGWGCAEEPLMHFIYVKNAFRRQGVARQLLAYLGFGKYWQVLYTHQTTASTEMALRFPQWLRYIGLELPKIVEEMYHARELEERASQGVPPGGRDDHPSPGPPPDVRPLDR